MSTKSKTFIQALDLVSTDPEKLRKILLDKRPNLTEKKIIEAILLLRDSKFNEIIDSLSPLKAEDPYVEDQRLQVLAAAYNNKSEPQKAWEYYQSSHELRKKHHIQTKQFYFLVYFFKVSVNCRHFEKSKQLYLELFKFCAKEKKPEHQLDLTICEYLVSVIDQNTKKSKSLLQNLKAKMLMMSEIQAINYHLLEYNFFLSLDDHEGAERALEEMKKFRKFRVSAEFKMMKSLLDQCYLGKPAYLYEQNYQEYPELFYQIRVINNLDVKNLAEATKAWSELKALAPLAYKDDFTYAGLPCIFATYLKKYKANLAFRPPVINSQEGLSKEDLLIQSLQAATHGLPKEQVFELIYGSCAEDKEDFVKLRTLISSARRKTSLNIKYSKGCYFIAS